MGEKIVVIVRQFFCIKNKHQGRGGCYSAGLMYDIGEGDGEVAFF